MRWVGRPEHTAEGHDACPVTDKALVRSLEALSLTPVFGVSCAVCRISSWRHWHDDDGGGVLGIGMDDTAIFRVPQS